MQCKWEISSISDADEIIITIVKSDVRSRVESGEKRVFLQKHGAVGRKTTTLAPSFPSPSSSPSSLAMSIILSFIRTSPRQVGHAPGRAVLGQGQHVKCSPTTRMAWVGEEPGWNKQIGDCCLSCAGFVARALGSHEFLPTAWTGGSDDGSKGEICALNSPLQRAISMDYTRCRSLYWSCTTAPKR